MASINGIGNNQSIHRINTQPVQRQEPCTAPAALRGQDKVELAGMSHLMQTLKVNNIRADKVAAIKAQLEAGTYDPDGAKLDAAIDRLLDDVMK